MAMEKISIAKARDIAERKGFKPGRVKNTDILQFTSGKNDRIQVIGWDEFEKGLTQRGLSIYESSGFLKIMRA